MSNYDNRVLEYIKRAGGSASISEIIGDLQISRFSVRQAAASLAIKGLATIDKSTGQSVITATISDINKIRSIASLAFSKVSRNAAQAK